MKLSVLLLINAIVILVYAVGALFVPSTMLMMYGMTPGVGDDIGGTAEARQCAADKKPTHRWRKRRDQIIHAKAKHRHKQKRPSPEGVRQIAQRWTKQELRSGKGEEHPAADHRGMRNIHIGYQ